MYYYFNNVFTYDVAVCNVTVICNGFVIVCTVYTSCAFPITEFRSKYSTENQEDEDHEEDSENTGWIVLRRIRTGHGSQDTV